MAYHYDLLNDLYYNVCADLAEKQDREEPSNFDTLMTVVSIAEVYRDTLNKEPNRADRVIGLTELANWQREKQFELSGATS